MLKSGSRGGGSPGPLGLGGRIKTRFARQVWENKGRGVGPGLFADLFVTQSVCTAFQRQTCTPCQEETSSRGGGRGGLGAAFQRSSADSELQARALDSTGAPGCGPLASNFPARSQIYDPTPAPAAPGDARPKRRAVNGSRQARRRRRPGGLRGGGAEVP